MLSYLGSICPDLIFSDLTQSEAMYSASSGLRFITKWLRTSGITAGIPVAAPLHHMDERLMHPEERRKQWRRAMQAD
jgi:hypothetical protein